MSAPDKPRPEKRDDVLEQAMAARLFGELSEEERRRLEAHLAESAEDRREWEALSSFFDDLGDIELPEAGAEFEQEMLARLSAETDAPQARIETVEGSERPVAATVTMVQGEVRRTASQRELWEPIEGGEVLHEGDAVDVGAGGRALLRLPDKSELWVNAGSVLRFGRREAGAFVRLLRGEILAFMAQQRRAFQVLTHDGAVSVLGTVFDTWVRAGAGTRVSVLRGRVEVNTGSGRREVQARRRLKVSHGLAPGRSHRMTAAEMRRLSSWAEPVRVATRMSGDTTIETVKRKIAMNGVLKLTGVAIVGALGLFGYHHWMRTADPTGVESALEQVQRQTAEARPIEIAEPVHLSFLPEPGDRWRQTTLLRGTVINQRTSRADQRQRFDIRIVSESGARAGVREGDLIVEHTVTEGVIESTDVRGDPNAPERQMEGEREFEDIGTGVKVVETYDAEGVRRGLRITGLDADAFDARTMLSNVFMVSHGIPTEPLTVGSSWTHHQPASPLEVAASDTTSTLDHFEEIGGQRMAVVRSHGTSRLTTPQDIGSISQYRPNARVTGRVSLTGFDLEWRGETRHRLDDGRPVLSTGRIEMRHETEIVGESRTNRPFRSTQRSRISGETTTEIEYLL
jgi:ferric-dicitrate binding protein FerR (iron transport regulator)